MPLSKFTLDNGNSSLTKKILIQGQITEDIWYWLLISEDIWNEQNINCLWKSERQYGHSIDREGIKGISG